MSIDRESSLPIFDQMMPNYYHIQQTSAERLLTDQASISKAPSDSAKHSYSSARNIGVPSSRSVPKMPNLNSALNIKPENNKNFALHQIQLN